MRSEAEFVAAIDCRFPYHDGELAQALIVEACSLSSNAAFLVAHELARRPRYCEVADAACLALLDRLDERLTHPLKGIVLDVARRMVRGELLPAVECLAVMEQVAAHPGEWSALGIVYFACEEVGMATVERAYGEIVAAWRQGEES